MKKHGFLFWKELFSENFKNVFYIKEIITYNWSEKIIKSIRIVKSSDSEYKYDIESMLYIMYPIRWTIQEKGIAWFLIPLGKIIKKIPELELSLRILWYGHWIKWIYPIKATL